MGIGLRAGGGLLSILPAWVALLSAISLIAPVHALAESGLEVELINATDELVVFEVRFSTPTITPVVADGREYVQVELPGCDHVTRTGEPDLPVYYVELAVPPGTIASSALLEQEEQPLGAARPLPVPELMGRRGDLDLEGSARGPAIVDATYLEDPAIYNGLEIYPATSVRADEPNRWRHLRVAQVAVYPVSYDPTAGSLSWRPRLRVAVRFVRTERAAREAEAAVPYLREEPTWEPLFERRILNYERAKRYKQMPRTAAAGPAATGRSLLLDEGDWNVQIGVDTTDVYAVTFAQLAAAGAPVSGVAWTDLKLEVRAYGESVNTQGVSESWRETYPIAFLPEDDGDGIFEQGESLIFWGEDAWDFFDLPRADRRFLRRNVYWLVAGAGEGARMDTLPGWLGVSGLTPVRDFVHTVHFEQNRYYMPTMTRDEGSEGPEAFVTDHYNWTYPLASEGGIRRPIKSVRLELLKVDRPLEMRVHLQGQYRLEAVTQHRPRLWLSRSRAVNDTTTMTWAFPGNPYQITEQDDSLIVVSEAELAEAAGLGASLTTGANYLKIYVPSGGDGIDNLRGEGIGIDWIEVTYRGLFWLQYNRLLAPLEDLLGVQQLKVERIAEASATPRGFLALEITDPRQPRAFELADSLFSLGAQNRWDLRLQVDFGATPASRTFFFIQRGDVKPVADGRIVANPAQPLAPFAGEDYVVIYPRRFAAALEPLLAHREAQGHRVYRAPLEDVFAEYSGGRPHVHAVKYMVRDMWRDGVNPPPDWLLLVGDGSSDIAGYSTGLPERQSDINHLPVMTVPGHFPATEGYQVVASDHWFVDNLLGRWTERMSYNEDMFVGRMTPATTSEVAVLVQKVLDYENQDPGASWRRRLLMHSDDGFSARGPNYYNADGLIFEQITGSGSDYIAADSALGHWTIDSLYHSAMMDSVVSLGRCVRDPANPARCLRDGQGRVVLVTGPVDQVANYEYGQTVVRAELERLLNRGVLVWAYQGHSNRYQLAHEFVYMHHTQWTRCVHNLTNHNRLFFFMGYGCHLADYSHWEEGWSGRGGDAMAEVMMLCCPGELKGAIAVFASTDYEWIGHRIQQHVFRVMFQDVPRDDQGRSRWRAGEICSLAKTYLQARDEQRITYTYLGDPALRLGIEPPLMVLTVNGAPWDPSSMTEVISAREDDSLAVKVKLHDQSHLTVPVIWDYVDGELRQVPEDRITILPDSTSDRILAIEYATQLQRWPYDLTVTAVDYDGSERQVTLKVPFAVGVYEEPAGGGQVPIATGSIVASTSEFSVTIRTGVHLDVEGLALRLAGETLELDTYTRQQAADGSFQWMLRYLGATALYGTHPLEVMVRQRDGEDLAVVSYQIQFGDVPLSIRQVEWIPSPFASETTLVYELTAAAARARLRVYTSSGRRIIDRDDLPATKGLHGIPWDGRDDDGDAIANGLYFYEFAVWDAAGRKAGSVLEKVVRVR